LLCVVTENENEGPNYFKIYKVEVETQLEKKIKIIRSGQGGEYFSKDFDLFCVERGRQKKESHIL
jgi:hypothetical protein